MLKCLACCCGGGGESDEDQSENTGLIRNGTARGGGSRGRDYGTGYANSAGGGGKTNEQNVDDEQAILSRILQQTANDVIDVSATDAHGVEPQEYMERARKYTQKLNVAASSGGGASSARRRDKCLLVENNQQQLDKCLTAPSAPHPEVAALKQQCQELGRIVQDIHVEHREDLVVPFAPS